MGWRRSAPRPWPARSWPAAISRRNRVVEENERPGTRAWMLDKNPDRAEIALSLSVDRRLLLADQREGRRHDSVLRQHRPGRKIYARHFSLGLLRRRRRPTGQANGRVCRHCAARARDRPQTAAQLPVASSGRADDSGRLAQRRLSRQADRLGQRSAKLRDLHRARRPAGRFSVPVQRSDLASLQSLAQSVRPL